MRHRSIGLGALLLVLTLAAVAPALAQQSGGVAVRGTTRIDANAKDVNTVAIGSGNTATTRIGVIDESTRHHTSVTVDVKNVDNIVTGTGRKGCINIGSTGKCD